MTADPEKTSKASQTSVASPKAQALLGSAPDEQIGAAIEAEKWARATDLIATHGERLLLDGGARELAAWLEALPDEHLARNVKVAALFAWVRIYDQRYQDALVCLSKAERALQQVRLAEGARPANGEAGSGARERTESEVELRPYAEIEQSLHAIRLHLQAVSATAGKLPAQVEHIMLPASEDHPLWRAAALVTLGRSRLLAGDLKGACDDLEAAAILASSSGGPRAARLAADAAVLLGRIDEARGKLDEAARRYEAIVRGQDPIEDKVAAEIGLARLALARLDPASAGPRLDAVKQAAAALGGEVDPIGVVVDGELARAWWHLLSGRADEARATLDQLEKTLTNLKLRWPFELIGATRARFALLRKEESGARRWLQQHALRGAAATTPTNPTAARSAVTAALVHAALHEPEPALAAARAALALAEASGHRQLATESQVALALAHFGLGHKAEARAALIAALEGARESGSLLAIFVRGLDVLADELGCDREEVQRVTRLLPSVPPPSRDKAERAVLRSQGGAGGPIETSRLVVPELAEVSDAGAAPEVERATPEEAEPASEVQAESAAPTSA